MITRGYTRTVDMMKRRNNFRVQLGMFIYIYIWVELTWFNHVILTYFNMSFKKITTVSWDITSISLWISTCNANWHQTVAQAAGATKQMRISGHDHPHHPLVLYALK